MKFDDARSLLGKRVRVTLAYPDRENAVSTVATGILLAFGDDGEFEILDDGGFMHYCWPMLDIEEF